MKSVELKNITLPFGKYLIEGADRYWQRYAVEKFISLTSDEYKDFNLHIFDNLKSLQEINEALNTVSMFATEPQVIIVRDKNYKEQAKDAGELNAIIAEEFNGYLVFSDVSFISAAQKKKLTVIDAGKLEPYELREQVQIMLNGVQADIKAIDKLIEYSSADMDRIFNEVEKLKAYTEGKKITLEVVEDLVANTVESEIFVFTDAIANQNKLKSFNILDGFYKKGLQLGYILATLTGLYRRMLYIKLSEKTDRELATLLNIKEYAIKKSREIANKYTKKQLKSYFDALTNAEYMFKSGTMSEEMAFKNAISKLII